MPTAVAKEHDRLRRAASAAYRLEPNGAFRNPAQTRLSDWGNLWCHQGSWADTERRLTENRDAFSNYRPPRCGRRRIDWILVTAGITVKAVGINAVRFDGAAAADHEPLHAALTIAL